MSRSVQKAFLTVEDVARRLSVNTTTVYRLAQQGSLPALKVGSQWRFPAQMLEEWVREQVGSFRNGNGKHGQPPRTR